MLTYPLMFLLRKAYFIPTQISGLQLWLDAKDSSTITIGTGVSQWSDKSGNSRHATQPTGANQPTYNAGSGAVVFDGVNDSLVVSATFSQPLSIFIVGKQTSKSTAARFLDASSPRALFGLTTSGFLNLFAVTGSNLIGSTDHSGTQKLFNTELNGGSSLARVNGNTELSGNVGTNGFGTLFIGRDSASSVSAFLNGEIKEIMIYNKILTDEETAKITNYLNRKHTIY